MAHPSSNSRIVDMIALSILFVSVSSLTDSELKAPSSASWCGDSKVANNSLKGIQCSGMKPNSATTLEACAAACCTSTDCNSYLFGSGSPHGCYIDSKACVPIPTSPPNWDGASKFTAPPTPAPPAPTPPPPSPNVLTQMIYGVEGCTGASVPHMTYHLSLCSTNLPFPQDRTYYESVATQITTSSPMGLNSSSFTISIYNATGCSQDLFVNFSITTNTCSNVSNYGQSSMWIKRYAPATQN